MEWVSRRGASSPVERREGTGVRAKGSPLRAFSPFRDRPAGAPSLHTPALWPHPSHDHQRRTCSRTRLLTVVRNYLGGKGGERTGEDTGGGGGWGSGDGKTERIFSF